MSGEGLIRSSGGWGQIKALLKDSIRLKGDERILRGSEFVLDVLNAGNEGFERKYLFRAQGYDFKKIVDRMAELLEMKPRDVMRSGKEPQTVKARSLDCFGIDRELGTSSVEITRQFKTSRSAVSRSSLGGEKTEEGNQYTVL